MISRDIEEEGDRFQPPQLLLVRNYFRSVNLVTSGAQTDFDFTQGTIAQLLMVCATSTLAYPVCYSIKLKRVRIWSAANALGATTTIVLEWNAGSTGFIANDYTITDTTMSSTIPCYISSRPPANTLAAWNSASGGGATGTNNVLFSVTCPGGSIIRIDYDYMLNLTESNVANSVAISGGSQGQIVARNPSSSIIVAAGLNSVS
jgi:hypothetical protein